MNPKAVAVLAGGVVAVAGVGTAIGDLGPDDEDDRPLQELEVRKDDGSDDVELVEEEDDRGDGDNDRDRSARGGAQAQDQGPTQDPQTGSGDNTGGTGNTAGTGWTGDTDGDWTDGNDGTGGGDNTYAAPAVDSYAAPAPAPAPAYYGDDDGGSYSGGDTDG
jgi:hypothetical protein